MKPYYQDENTTIYHGDCREVLPTIKGQKLIITSPPYGVGKEYEKDSSELDWEFLIRGFLTSAASSMEGGDFLCLNLPERLVMDDWTGMRPAMPLIWRDLAQNGLLYYDKRIWKKAPVWSSSHWHGSTTKAIQETEEIYILKKKGISSIQRIIIKAIVESRDEAKLTNEQIGKHVGFTGRMVGHWTSLTSQPEVPTLENWEKLKEILPLDPKLDVLLARHHRKIRSRLEENEWRSWGSRQIWDIKPVQTNDGHPAAFPTELARRCIMLWSEPETIIVDPFMGSGTTLKAAKDLKRKSVGIEKDEGYCQLSLERMRQQTLMFSEAI